MIQIYGGKKPQSKPYWADFYVSNRFTRLKKRFTHTFLNLGLKRTFLKNPILGQFLRMPEAQRRKKRPILGFIYIDK